MIPKLHKRPFQGCMCQKIYVDHSTCDSLKATMVMPEALYTGMLTKPHGMVSSFWGLLTCRTKLMKKMPMILLICCLSWWVNFAWHIKKVAWILESGFLCQGRLGVYGWGVRILQVIQWKSMKAVLHVQEIGHALYIHWYYYTRNWYELHTLLRISYLSHLDTCFLKLFFVGFRSSDGLTKFRGHPQCCDVWWCIGSAIVGHGL